MFNMDFLFYSLIFLFGLCVGSFLNVVIWRLDTDEGIVVKRSHCPKCGHVLRWYDLIPVLSFVLLGGKCRDCAKPISWQYPIVEITTGLLFLLIFNQFINFQFLNIFFFIFWLFIVSCLIVIFVYDLRHYLIPDKIIYLAIVVTFLFRFFEIVNFRIENLLKIENWDLKILSGYLLSALGASAFFLAVVLITRGRGMGLGDVKLAFLMGLILGWPQILLALLLAFGGGAIVGVGLVIANRKTLKSQIPFGPFLVGSTIFTLLASPYLIDWYFNFLGL